MFHLDNTFYSKQDLDVHMENYTRKGLLNLWHGKRIAMRCKDIYQWLTLVLITRDLNIQLLAMHGDTPLTSATEKALESDCDYLLVDTIENMEDLSEKFDKSTIGSSKNSTRNTGGLIQFSSGTTGEPKAIFRSWEEIQIEIDSYNHLLAFSSDVMTIIACPVTHSYGLIAGFLASIERHTTPHIISGMNTRFLADVCKQYDKPFVYSSPQFLESLIQVLSRDSSSMRTLYGAMTSGTTLPKTLFSKLKQSCQFFYQQYGCSEAGCISVAKNPVNERDIGYPLKHLHLTAGSELSPSVILVKNSEHTIDTKDIGYINDSGSLQFCARRDDTIVVSGLNVFPAEVESCLLEHPSIRDVVVFKSSPQSQEHEQKVIAQYVSDKAIDNTELRRWCHRYLARYQWPSQFHRTNEIARLSNSKVNRRWISENFSMSEIKNKEFA